MLLVTLQVATALLVVGSSPTLWILGQTLHPLAGTQASFKGCMCNVDGSLWLVPINAH